MNKFQLFPLDINILFFAKPSERIPLSLREPIFEENHENLF